MPADPAVLFVVGPTASGKTGTAVACALALDGEIVGADSRQIYRDFDIGTAKPSPDERARVPHHLVGTVDPRERYSAGRYVRDAGAAVRDIAARGRTPIVAGGTGLYVRALADGIFASPDISPELRAALSARLASDGLPALAAELLARDPAAADLVDLRNPRRVLRALEVCLASGSPYTALRAERRGGLPGTVFFAGLLPGRDALRRRIDARAARMIADGLVEETRSLLDRYGADAPAMDTLGYRETAAAIRTGGETPDLAALIALHTRQYARRQSTWFRAEARIRWYGTLEGEEPAEIARRIVPDFLDAKYRRMP
jgi:tRNA dimethylallyltransferase